MATKESGETLLEHVFSTKAQKHRHLKKLSELVLAHAHESTRGVLASQLRMGDKIEMEHTHDPATARQIAIDHLRELPDYYSRLKKMESAGEKAKEKKANYKLQGEYDFNGLDIAVENKKGTKRYWYDEHGKEKGSTHMHFDYGYIRLTKGTDGDHVDCYVGPNKDAKKVFLVNQMKKPPGEIKKDGKAWTEFDEQKCMLGFESADAAKAAYMRQYDDPRFFGTMTEMSFEDFKREVLDKSNHGKKLAELLKESCGDMLQYFADHSEKLKEKKMRDKVKTAVSAGWIREKAVSGLAKRNVALDGKQQAEIARKAIGYARAKAAPLLGAGAKAETTAAREELRGVLGGFKQMKPNTGRKPYQESRGWRPSSGAYSAAEQENARQYDSRRYRGYQGHRGAFDSQVSQLLGGLGLGTAGNIASIALQRGPQKETEKLKRMADRGEKGKRVNFDNIPEPTGSKFRSVAMPIAMAAGGAGSGMIMGSGIGRYGHVVGGGLGAIGGALVGRAAHERTQKLLDHQRGRVDALQEKEAALSPAMLSSLQHGAVGAGIGAVAGGLGGMAHAAPGSRGEGFGRGALVGAGLGAAGGAGVAALKNHGAQQLSTLQSAAGKAHQDAIAAHAMAGRTVADPALARTGIAAGGAGTVAGKAGVVGRPGAPGGGLHLDTQQKAVMSPAAWGHNPTTVGAQVPHEVAQAQAASAGGRAEALRRAAETLGQQQQVMNKGINRAALVGAGAGTGLMGYMAVPRQYGGVGTKQASDSREGRIADRLDDVGIATLASPYLADAAAGGLKKLMLRGGRVGALAAEGHGIAEAVAHKLHNNPAVELGGLAMVAPGVTHTLARGMNKVLPQQQPQISSDVLKTAEDVGRALANSAHTIKLSGNARLALGLGAIGLAGATVVGGKKAIDTAQRLATHHAEPAQYVGTPMGMRPPIPAGA